MVNIHNGTRRHGSSFTLRARDATTPARTGTRLRWTEIRRVAAKIAVAVGIEAQKDGVAEIQ